jgi:hypothetical protein
MNEVSSLPERDRQTKLRRLLDLDEVPSRATYRPANTTMGFDRGGGGWRGGLQETKEDKDVIQEMAGLVSDVLDVVRRQHDGLRV